MYSLNFIFNIGASLLRMRYSLSKRCIMNGTQARPDSIQMIFSFGKRSGKPFMIQFAMCIMLWNTKPSAWTVINLLAVEKA